jgi:hypothetical protein
MQEPKHSEVREKQFLSKPTAKRPKLTEGQHKSKFDLSHHSKFLNRFSLWGAVFLFYWTFAIYGWRVMFFHFSVERKVLAKHKDSKDHQPSAVSANNCRNTTTIHHFCN